MNARAGQKCQSGSFSELIYQKGRAQTAAAQVLHISTRTVGALSVGQTAACSSHTIISFKFQPQILISVCTLLF